MTLIIWLINRVCANNIFVSATKDWWKQFIELQRKVRIFPGPLRVNLIISYHLLSTTRSNNASEWDHQKVSDRKRESGSDYAFELRAPRSSSPPLHVDTKSRTAVAWTGYESRRCLVLCQTACICSQNQPFPWITCLSLNRPRERPKNHGPSAACPP